MKEVNEVEIQIFGILVVGVVIGMVIVTWQAKLETQVKRNKIKRVEQVVHRDKRKNKKKNGQMESVLINSKVVHIHRCSGCGGHVDVIQTIFTEGWGYWCLSCQDYMKTQPNLFRSQGKEYPKNVVPLWYVEKNGGQLLARIGRFSIYTYSFSAGGKVIHHIMINDDISHKMVHSVASILGWEGYIEGNYFPFDENDLMGIATRASQLDGSRTYECWFLN